MMVRNKREVIVFFFFLYCFVLFVCWGRIKRGGKAIEERGS